MDCSLVDGYYWVRFRFPEEVGRDSWIVLYWGPPKGGDLTRKWWSIGYGRELENWRIIEVGPEIIPPPQ